MAELFEPVTAIDRPAYPIESVENALRLILLFKDQRTVSVADAATILDVARSTAHRLLSMLAFYRFVRQNDERGPYTAGPALLEVGFGSVQRMDLRTIARPHLEELVARVGETAYLVLRSDAQIIFIDTIESTQPLRLTNRTGTTFSAHGSASGRVLLAKLSDKEILELFPNETLPPSDPRRARPEAFSKRSELITELAKIRHRGFSMNYNVPEAGICSAAAAVCGQDGRSLAAVGIAAPQSRVSRHQLTIIAQNIIDTTRRIGAALP